jgi:O-antigen ligase
MMSSSVSAEVRLPGAMVAENFHAAARGLFWLLAFGVMVVIPWAFGGNGPEGYYWITWTGKLCLLPLALWAVASGLRRELPDRGFWIAVICWGLLATQVIFSLSNPSHETQPPWVGDGYVPIPHNETLPSTAFEGATVADGHLWLAYVLLALTAKSVGLTRRQLRLLLWAFVINATALALIGIPFKFSGESLILGKWEVQEKYFYSTFLYHNHWCAYALLALGSTVALYDSTQRQGARLVLLFLGMAIAASAPLSTSRLGTLAMAAFVLAIITVFVRRRFTGERRSIGNMPSLVAAGILGAIVIGGGTAYFYRKHATNRGDRTWSEILRSNPFGLRQTFVEDTIPMVTKKPWFGWGLGAYGAAFRFYQRAETRIVQNQGRVTLYDHIHDDWVERLAELGVIGFGLFLAPGIAWCAAARKKKSPGTLQFWLLAGSASVLLFAFGDMAFVNNTVSATFAVLFPLAVATSRPSPPDQQNP